MWPKIEFSCWGRILFQSTHPRRVWLGLSTVLVMSILFQSTHPRRVWPLESSKICASWAVSIHTPTQGVTMAQFNNLLLLLFQSTHPRRVWQILILLRTIMSLFQSTHPRRVWHILGTRLYETIMFQSTHPRRVWLIWLYRYYWFDSSFNPHTHAGCD